MGNTLTQCGCANDEQSVADEQQIEAQTILQQQWSARNLHNQSPNSKLDDQENCQDAVSYTELPNYKNILELNHRNSQRKSNAIMIYHLEQVEVKQIKASRDFEQTAPIVTFNNQSDSSLDQSEMSIENNNNGELYPLSDKLSFKVDTREETDDNNDYQVIKLQKPKIKKPPIKKRLPSERKKKSLARKRAFYEEKEVVLKEGELLKICPGVARLTGKNNKKDSIGGGSQFVTRWCQLTENRFRYYKNKINAYKQPEKPLLSIPLSEIVKIVKSKINKDEVQFELSLSKEMSKYFRDKGVVEKMFETPSKRNQQESPDREIKAGHLIRVPLKLKDSLISPLKNKEQTAQSRNGTFQRQYQTSICSEITDKNHWSKREEEWFNLEEMLLFKNNVNNMTEGNISNILEWIKQINNQRKAKGHESAIIQQNISAAQDDSKASIYQSPSWKKEQSDTFGQ